MQEIETVETHCKFKDCVHRGMLSGKVPFCGYILNTEQSRGCDISKCDKCKKSRGRKPEIDKTASIRWMIIEEDQW